MNVTLRIAFLFGLFCLFTPFVAAAEVPGAKTKDAVPDKSTHPMDTAVDSGIVSRADELGDLQAQRIETLEQAVRLTEAQYGAGQVTIGQLLDAQAELLSAKLDAASTPEQRVEVLKQQVKLSAAAEKFSEARFRAGHANQTESLFAKAARLRVEILLLKEKKRKVNSVSGIGTRG